MQQAWLQERLDEGRSLEHIAREAGCHPSTVGYWLKRHGLTAVGANRFSPRGGLSRHVLERMVDQGMTLREMAEALDRSVSTVRHWLGRWGIERQRVRGSRTPVDPTTAPREATLACPRHGSTVFVLEGRGAYRCKQCRLERVSAWRRRLKLRLVDEAGGACCACGYADCAAALQFHHLDPETKSFALSSGGIARALEKVRAEAEKCVLLCANCHAEVEAGHRVLPVDSGENSPGRIRTSKN